METTRSRPVPYAVPFLTPSMSNGSRNSARVSVILVLFDGHLHFLSKCISALVQQEERHFELIIVDNTSAGFDIGQIENPRYTLKYIRNRVIPSLYCHNNNLGLHEAGGRYAVILNLDVRLEPQYLSRCADAMDKDPTTGLASGRLRRMDPSFTPLEPPVLDSTGMTLSPTVRHFDRDWGLHDREQRVTLEYVAGATGAALFLRIEMVRALSLSDGSWFDEDFQMGREDADISLRAWMAGWHCLYVPDAIAYHVRTTVPGGRNRMPAWFNMHQVKNRYLLRVNNLPLGAQLALAPFWVFRDLQAVLYVLLFERSSLQAYRILWRERRRLLTKRRFLKRHWRHGWVDATKLFLSRGLSQPWPRASH